MQERNERLILVRFSSETSIKGRGTRIRFTKKLVGNLSDALRSSGASARITPEWSRIFVRTDAEDAEQILARVPGVSSLSVVEAQCAADLEEIVRTGLATFRDRVQGRSYAVRCSRTGRHDFRSTDVQQSLGAALNPGATVDLTHPEVEVEVEVRDERAYFFSSRVPGMEGLPLGVEGRAVCLISGGFDSAVAAWMMLKRGVQLDYVFCNLAGEAYEHSVVQVSKILSDEWSYGTRPKLHVVDFAEPLKELRAHSHPRYWQLVLKRLMYRAAEQIALQSRASAIVTGEAIGQVSSQTLANLRAIDGAVDFPIFRPLIGFDKNEIIRLSRRVGTFGISSRVKEYCAIAPGNPATSASPRQLEEQEVGMEQAVVSRAVAGMRTLDLRELNVADLVQAYLFTDAVPENAVLLDVRSEGEWEAWHYPGALHREMWDLLRDFKRLDRDPPYLLYCGHGLQAAHLAEQMQREGYEAYAFRGGTRALKAYAEAQGNS